MGLETVTFDTHDGITRIMLNRPERLNAISPLLLSELTQVVRAVERDPEVRVVTLTGMGRAFCTGADLQVIRTLSTDAVKRGEFMRLWHRVLSQIAALPQPVVAGVHGYALAGGLELVLVADLVVMEAGARIGDHHANLGLVPTGGGSQRLPRLIGARRAKELMLQGGWLDAQQAMAWGLVNKIVPAGQAAAAVEKLARALAARSDAANRGVKRLIDRGLDLSLAEGLELEFRMAFDHLRSPDVAEGLRAVAERRPPAFNVR